MDEMSARILADLEEARKNRDQMLANFNFWLGEVKALEKLLEPKPPEPPKE